MTSDTKNQSGEGGRVEAAENTDGVTLLRTVL